jgi:uncharacterized protein involved in exopolysaccharide biosynthesis
MPSALPEPRRPLNLLDYLSILRRHAVLIAASTVLSGALAIGYSLSLARIFEAKATIITPREGGSAGMASSLTLSSLAQSIPGISTQGLTPNRDLFVSLLRARTTAEKVAADFRLAERYHSKNPLDAVASLQGATDVTITKEGVITITVSETDPVLAAGLANSYVKHLDEMILQFGTVDAGKQRQFIEKRLVQTEAELRQAEESLCQFQESHRAVALHDQAKGAVEAVSSLKSQIVGAEVQLEVLRNSATEENSEVVKIKRRIEEMKRQLSQLQYGKGLELPGEDSSRLASRTEIYVPVSDYPELSLELARLTRDMMVQEKIYGLLLEQLEQAKIAEARDTPNVRPLDEAIPPLRHSKPVTRLNATIGAIAGLLFGLFLTFFHEYLKNLRRGLIPPPPAPPEPSKSPGKSSGAALDQPLLHSHSQTGPPAARELRPARSRRR